jgi:membrane-associated phospholipid phosphatase
MSLWAGGRHQVDDVARSVLTLGIALVTLVVATWALGALVTGGNIASNADHATLTFMLAHRSMGLDRVARAVTALGSGIVLLPVAVAFAGVWRWRRTDWLAAWTLAASYVGASLSFNTVKRLTLRPRPGARFQLVHAGGYAFPSGHATQAAAMWGAMAFLVALGRDRRARRVAPWIAAATIAALVGLSRLYLGVHWLSDVLAGWALGGLWLFAVLVACRRAALERSSTNQHSRGLSDHPTARRAQVDPAW